MDAQDQVDDSQTSDREAGAAAGAGPSRRQFLRGAGGAALVVGTVGVVGCTSDSVGVVEERLVEPVTTVPTEPPTVPPLEPPAATPPPAPTAVPTATTVSGNFADFGKAAENWTQPWVWRPNGDRQLQLSVVEDQQGLLFSYAGATPGPTIRMRGDETLRVRVDNELGEDAGKTAIREMPGGPGGSPYPGPEGDALSAAFKQSQAAAFGGTREAPVINKIPNAPVDDWRLGEHVNGIHSAHVTNLHTHGLHVTSGRNEDGTHSDNIYLRIVPHADWERIEEARKDDPELLRQFQLNLSLKDGEFADASANFEFILGRTPTVPVHPPGTHWYHPHSHGSTFNQVASGMAGFLLVEGDVDDQINQFFTNRSDPNPSRATGQWDYRERTMFVQRIFNNVSTDPDRDRTNLLGRKALPIKANVNGQVKPTIMIMRPGGVERWRVLNGSVDGSGFIRVMVLKGRFEIADGGLVRVDLNGGDNAETAAENEFNGTMNIFDETLSMADLKQRLWQLSRDGVTMVTNSETDPKYTIRNLDLVNGGQEPNFSNRAECYEGENMKLIYTRPNEVALAAANRSDVMFQAPLLAGNEKTAVYTVVGMPSALHATPKGGGSQGTTTTPTVIGHVLVTGTPVDGDSDLDFGRIPLPDVPAYLYPIPEDEVALSPIEELEGYGSGYRSRTVRYSGWGHAGWPHIPVPQAEVDAHRDLNKLIYYVPPEPNAEGLKANNADNKLVPVRELVRYGVDDDELPTVLIPPNTRTMAIDGEKFQPTSTNSPRMFRNTAEEWAVFNESVDCYSITPPKQKKDESDGDFQDRLRAFCANNADEIVYWNATTVDGGEELGPRLWGNPVSYPVLPVELPGINARREGEGKAPLDQFLTGGADHPFHIHQNPFWLMRIDVPNNDGELVNVLDHPQWADVSFLPRNGGRIVFRSRFMDYVGEYVNHCHILQHEDNGMMQRVEVVYSPEDPDYDPSRETTANYDAVPRLASFDGDIEDVYPRPSQAEMYERSVSFLDANNSGQTYPFKSGWIPASPRP